MDAHKYRGINAFGNFYPPLGIPFLHSRNGLYLCRIVKLLGFARYNGIDTEECTEISDAQRYGEIQRAFRRSVRRYGASVCAAVAGVEDQHRQRAGNLRRRGTGIFARKKHTLYYDTNPKE